MTEIYHQFYDANNKKCIPKNLKLFPLGLATWFMDDGARNRRSVYFNTQQFCLSDQIILLNVLKKQFGLLGTLNRDKSYWRIRLYQDSAQKMKRLIELLMPNCMKYKLPS